MSYKGRTLEKSNGFQCFGGSSGASDDRLHWGVCKGPTPGERKDGDNVLRSTVQSLLLGTLSAYGVMKGRHLSISREGSRGFTCLLLKGIVALASLMMVQG